MAQPRPSSFGTTPEQEARLNAAHDLHARLDKSNLQLLQHINDFNSKKLDPDEYEDIENTDPAIVAADVGSQLVRILYS